MYDYATNQDLASQNVPTSLLTQINFRFVRHPPPIGGECRWNSSLTGAVLFFLHQV